MAPKPFSELFPLSTDQFNQLVKVEPHEFLGGRNTWQGRRVVGELFGREIFLFLFQIPFYIIFNLILLIGKISQTIWRTMLLCQPSQTGTSRLKAVSLSMVDHVFLIPILPLFRLAIIGKLAIASLFPKIYLKRPAKVSVAQQEIYYKKCIRKAFDHLLGHQMVTLEIRTLLHHLRKAVALVASKLIDLGERKDFYRDVYRHMNQLQKETSEPFLKAFDSDLKQWAQKVKIELPPPPLMKGESAT